MLANVRSSKVRGRISVKIEASLSLYSRGVCNATVLLQNKDCNIDYFEVDTKITR